MSSHSSGYRAATMMESQPLIQAQLYQRHHKYRKRPCLLISLIVVVVLLITVILTTVYIYSNIREPIGPFDMPNSFKLRSDSMIFEDRWVIFSDSDVFFGYIRRPFLSDELRLLSTTLKLNRSCVLEPREWGQSCTLVDGFDGLPQGSIHLMVTDSYEAEIEKVIIYDPDGAEIAYSSSENDSLNFYRDPDKKLVGSISKAPISYHASGASYDEILPSVFLAFAAVML